MFFAQPMHGQSGAYPVRGTHQLGESMASYRFVMITGLIISVSGMLLITSNTTYYIDTNRTFTELVIKSVIVALGVLIYKRGEHLRLFSVDSHAMTCPVNNTAPRLNQAFHSHHFQSSSGSTATSTPTRPNIRHTLEISLNDRASTQSLDIFKRTRILLLEQLKSRGMGIGHIKANSTSESRSTFEADIYPAGEVSLTRGKDVGPTEASQEFAQPCIQLQLSALNVSPNIVISMLHDLSMTLQEEFEGVTFHETSTAINAVWNTSRYKAEPSRAGWSMKADVSGSQDQQTSRDMGLLQRIFSFDGRIRRSTLWVNGIVNSVIYLILFAILSRSSSSVVTLIALAGFVALGIRGFSLSVRRWHDLDKSGSWVLIGFVPFIGALYAAVMLGFMSGDAGPNSYGAAPEEGQLW
jgi:uncharacterized membrane protein YhaH (DUF805 family)